MIFNVTPLYDWAHPEWISTFVSRIYPSPKLLALDFYVVECWKWYETFECHFNISFIFYFSSWMNLFFNKWYVGLNFFSHWLIYDRLKYYTSIESQRLLSREKRESICIYCSIRGILMHWHSTKWHFWVRQQLDLLKFQIKNKHVWQMRNMWDFFLKVVSNAVCSECINIMESLSHTFNNHQRRIQRTLRKKHSRELNEIYKKKLNTKIFSESFSSLYTFVVLRKKCFVCKKFHLAD